MTPSAEAVICGAGIAGVAAAHALTARYGLKRVVLVDDRPPLTLTSDKSTECYRNWWHGPDGAMIALMNRSIDLLEEFAHHSNNSFLLNRRGYVYATADPARVPAFIRAAQLAAGQGAGPARIDEDYRPSPEHGFDGVPTGADVITDVSIIRKHFPYLSERTTAIVHARRAGWFSGQQLGMYLLEEARASGAELLNAHVEGLEITGGRVTAVRLSGGGVLPTGCFVNAAGPLAHRVGQMAGIRLPIFSELHVKVAFKDHLGVIPRAAPMLIWADPQVLDWDDDERAMLSESAETLWMLGELPAGVHTRPEGGEGSNIALMLWAHHTPPVEPRFPHDDEIDPSFSEIVLRGLTKMIPSLKQYVGKAPRPVIDSGYYTKTRENRLLVGSMGVEGAYMIGAMSGYGLMAAPAAADLLAAHVSGAGLPAYAAAFALSRYENPNYLKMLDRWDDTGQL